MSIEEKIEAYLDQTTLAQWSRKLDIPYSTIMHRREAKRRNSIPV